MASFFPSHLFRIVLALAALGLTEYLRAETPALPGFALPGTTSTVSAATDTTTFTAESIAARRAALQKEIATTRDELSKLPEGMSGDAARWLTEETALLERIDAVYAEEQRTWQHASDLGKEASDVSEQTRNRRPPEATLNPPYDIALLDQLYAERDYLEQARDLLKKDVENAQTLLQEARDTLTEKDKERRAARESKPAAGSKTQGNLRLAELESRLAQENVTLCENALKTLKLQQSLLEPKQTLLRPRFDWLRAHLNVQNEEPPAIRQKAQKAASDLDRAIATAKQESESVTQAVIATERRSAAENNTEELESRRASRQTANLTLSVLTAQRARIAEHAKVAEMRRQVLSGGTTAKELRALGQDNHEAMAESEHERQRVVTELVRSRKELQDLQGRMTSASTGDVKASTWNVDRIKRLSGWIELSQKEVVDLDALRTERSRLQEEIGERVNLFSWTDTMNRTREGAVAAWNYELFSVKDEPVRVKTILAVFLLISLGYFASRWLSRLLARAMFSRLEHNVGRRAAWQTLWFYGLFVVVLVAAFDLFHLSLTQFSVVSGALAVGLGFGSQNLMSNFISGIILLIERPVNQGDVIEIDGRQVTVERLGARSTIVRTLDNTHMILPNNRLLEQPVINWTLSDQLVRKHISIGVAYDSPTRKVAELLQGVLVSVESVLKEPAPSVKFADFGDSALVFEIYFWVSISNSANPVEAENELRHRVAEVFAKEKIVLAFPQRDVHLETSKPLQVELTSSPPPKPNDVLPAPLSDPGKTQS